MFAKLTHKLFVLSILVAFCSSHQVGDVIAAGVESRDQNVLTRPNIAADIASPGRIARARPKEIGLAFSTNQDYVEIPGKVFARDYFWAVWSRRGPRACNETPYQLKDGNGGQGCTIKFECHGNSKEEWVSTNGLSQTLISIVGAQRGIEEHTSRKERVCVETCEGPGHGTKCCQWENQDVWTTKIARTIEIYARNVEDESDYGAIRYTLDCPVPENPLCTIAKLLASSLSFFAPGMGEELKMVAKAFSAGSAAISGATVISC